MGSAPKLAKVAETLRPGDWVRAGLARLSGQGIDAVRVELLARDLHVSKGSFYWHFRDRQDLLEQVLANWELQELELLGLNEEAGGTTATRWAEIVQASSDPGRMQLEASVRAWARRNNQVAVRVAAVDLRKAKVIEEILHDIGFAPLAAQAWSEVVLLLCLGWQDRATRDRQFQLAGRSLSDFLSDVILAASSSRLDSTELLA
ncbi:MAG TPA: helix-turn-helix domain-containing protein [Candidatus Aquilonibacter sp.]|nr:helix-turn-helix domain-containing protein [Candidatus Aquilonibacter sp.]